MQFYTSHRSKSRSFSKRPLFWIAVFVLFVFGALVYSKSVHASLSSYVHTIFNGGKVSAKVKQEQSRTDSRSLALLQAAVNSNPSPEKPSDVSPVVGNALAADVVLSEGAPTENSTRISSYVVREGDTVSSIAKMFGVSVNTVMWANGISRASALSVGQTLIILPVTGISYTIKKGDTIKGIAGKYRADVDEILYYNDLSINSSLIAGHTIIIPDAEQAPVQNPDRPMPKSNKAHDTNGPEYPGYYIRPIAGGVKTQGLHGYNGIDLASSLNTPILASAAGTVIVSASSGWNGGYGKLVILSHDNGTQTVYGHLSKNLVSVGQRVEQGQTIALMGNSGNVVGITGIHLHFEIRGAKNPF